MYNRGGFNWTWIFLLFFGFSIAGMISAALVQFLAFPYAWSGLISFLLIGTAAFLLFQGYGGQMWLLAGCVLMVLLVGLALVRSVTITKPDSIPDGIPEAMLEDDNFTPASNDYEFEADADKFAVFFNLAPRTLVRILFDHIQTPGGVWAFADGGVRVTSPLSFVEDAESDAYFNDRADVIASADEPLLSTQPYIEVALPLNERFREQQFMLDAAVTVVYAEDDELREETLQRTLSVYVAGEDFFFYQQEYADYARARSFVENPFELAGLGIVGALALAGAVIIYRQGEWRTRNVGGLQMVIRSQSGTQRLGVEAFDPETIDGVVPPPDGGVFIGRVEAQSPAGRGGLMTNDIMLRFDGKPVKSPRELSRLASKAERGQAVVVEVLRYGEPQELTIRF